MATGSAIVGAVGVATSLFQTIKGGIDAKNAREDANELLANQQPVTNPYAMLQPSTIGSNLQSTQALRSGASQLDTLSSMGSRGGSFVSQVGRQDALMGQQIASGLDEQQKRIDMLKARGEQFKFQAEEDRFNRQMAGFSNQYNAGQQNVMGGVSNMAGTLASGFAQGGAFSGLMGQGGGQIQPQAQYQHAATNYNTPSGLQQLPTQGFQPLVIG